jgi:hypothetical protein
MQLAEPDAKYYFGTISGMTIDNDTRIFTYLICRELGALPDLSPLDCREVRLEGDAQDPERTFVAETLLKPALIKLL